MKNKKQILTIVLSVLLPVFLVSAVAYATTVGNDVSVGGDLDIVGTDLQTTTGTLNLSKSTSMTTVKGTLNVDEAVTFDTTLGVSGATTITSAGASALAVGLAGATNPALKVDASTASSATGLQIKSAAAAGGLAVSVISSGTNEKLILDAKGSGTITIGNISTGALNLSSTTVMTTVKGTLNVDEAVTFDSTLGVTGVTTLTGALVANGDVTLGNAAGDTLTVYAPLVWAATTTTYGIDLNAATSSTADIRLSNGETISNATDGRVAVAGGTIWQSETVTALEGVGTSYRGIYANITVPATITEGTQYYQGVRGETTSAANSSVAETWGGNFINNVGGSVIAAYGVVGELNVTGSGTVSGAVNTFISAGYFHSDIPAAVTLTNIQDVPLVGIIESSTGRAKADAAVGAVLAGAINQSTAGAGAAFKVYDFNTTAAFDYGLDLYYSSGSYSNVFGTADIRLSNSETIDNVTNGTILLTATTISLSGDLTVTGNDITFGNGETISNATDGTIQVLGGTLKSGNSASTTTAGGSTMIYGFGLQKTNALTGDLIGVRGDARLNVDSPSGLVMGGYFMAVNGPEGGTGYDADTMRGIYIIYRHVY